MLGPQNGSMTRVQSDNKNPPCGGFLIDFTCENFMLNRVIDADPH